MQSQPGSSAEPPKAELPRAESPKAEPEIIPPGMDYRPDRQPGPTVFAYRTTRIQVARLGPVGITLVLLAAGVLAVAGAALLLGAALIGAIVGGVVVLGAIASRFFRGAFRR